MSRCFEAWIDHICEDTEYDYDFLVDRYNDVMEEDGDVAYFLDVTYERDW